MPPQPVPTDFFGKVWHYFQPTNEFVYLGMLAIVLFIAVVFNGKRTIKEIWGEIWPKLVFLALVYAVIMIIVWAMKET